jgi:3-deoxy-7-phosphoheptulonate synthase
MILIRMKPRASLRNLSGILKVLEREGHTPRISRSGNASTIGVIGGEDRVMTLGLDRRPGVDRVTTSTMPFKLAGREFKANDTIVRVHGIPIGDRQIVVIAGPCAVESFDQLLGVAKAVKAAGARLLRGGAFKPRTSPYSFRGLGPEGLKMLSEVRKRTGLAIVTEVLSPEDTSLVADHADVLQIGSRNMQNFPLLESVGKAGKPVLLKRGLMSTLEELYMSAEYILSNGNSQVILCERGIRTFEGYTRNTLDVTAVPVTKRLTHLPILIDPSHATGDRALVRPAALAGVSAGADGLLVEVHPDPDRALCDGPQSITPADFARLMIGVRRIAQAIGRSV